VAGQAVFAQPCGLSSSYTPPNCARVAWVRPGGTVTRQEAVDMRRSIRAGSAVRDWRSSALATGSRFDGNVFGRGLAGDKYR
jgi:hypothetical protein